MQNDYDFQILSQLSQCRKLGCIKSELESGIRDHEQAIDARPICLTSFVTIERMVEDFWITRSQPINLPTAQTNL